MPPLHFLIKPASSNCNMRCRYCFYEDVADNRDVRSYGIMTDEMLRTVVKTGLDNAQGECSFMFQGGEPTFAGLDFYRRAVQYQKEYNTRGIRVNNSIQTNGYVIDREWAQFLAREKFLVGLSLDGMKDVHDLYRIDAHGKGTFSRVMHAAQLFQSCGVEFNILTVVTAQTAKNIGKIYSFFKRNGFHYQQYIPCLDPFGEPRGQRAYSLTPELYARFLKNLFDLWYADFMRGQYVSIRWFDELAHMCQGLPPSSCGMIGRCSPQIVIEADGGIYPCDFYVLDSLRLGTIGQTPLDEVEKKRHALQFIEQSMKVEDACRACRYKNICRGGCRRDREQPDGSVGMNYYCQSFREFFDYAGDRLVQVARLAR